MPTYTTTPPDRHVVRLRVMDAGVDLTRWTRYQFASNFLTPSDGWSMTVSDGNLDSDQRRSLRIGSTVRLYVDTFPLAEGVIDAVEIGADRRGGTTYTIEGRDRLGAAVDSIADPRKQYNDGTTLAEFLKDVFGPFGWVTDEHFIIDNSANRDAKTGGVRGTPTSRGKKTAGRPLRNFVLHQLKPHNHEGVFRFAARVAERFGLFIWPTADGDQLVVGSPDFLQPARYELRRFDDGSGAFAGGTNIEHGTVRFDGTDQPSVIIADGFSGGGEFGKSRIIAACVNPYFGIDQQGFVLDEVSAVLANYPDAEQVLFVTQNYPATTATLPARPAFIHDEESKTQEQLAFYLKRTMSDLIRRSLVCHYTVDGLGQVVDGVFTPWDIDTIASVHDEVAGVSEDMYIIGRTFEQSRSGGTYTHLELVRKFSIAVGNQAEQQSLKSSQPGLVDNSGDGKPRPVDSIVFQNKAH